MAKIIKQFTKGKPGPKSKYNWDEWFDGQTRELTQGKDFTCSVATFERYARKMSKANPKVTTLHLGHPRPRIITLFAELKTKR